MRGLRLARIGLVALVACSGTGSGPSPAPASVSVHGGDAQVGAVGTALPVPASVRVVDGAGGPTPGVAVVFTVQGGGGTASAATVRTDADGVAAVTWTLGTAPGANALEASVSGLPSVTFSASALAGPPATVAKEEGDAQVAPPGAELPVPPAVVVSDRFGNPVAGAVVDFAVTAGGGAAWCSSATTDATGRASCPSWTMGTAHAPNTLSATVGGLSPAVFTATIRGEVALMLGFVDALSLKADGTRLLTLGWDNRWVLWDVATASVVASGYMPCHAEERGGCNSAAELAGGTAVLSSPSGGFEVRDASDGHVLSRIVGRYPWIRLASDGSYVYAGTKSALSAWGRDGQLLFTRPGDYSLSKTFADGAVLRVARGPAGANVIETIVPSTGQSSVGSTFNGTFHSWFQDGDRFITNLSTTVWVYSGAGTEEAVLSLLTVQNLTGQGRWLWTHQDDTPGYRLTLYRIDGDGTPAASYELGVAAKLSPGKDVIGVAFDPSAAVIIDLSGASPSRRDYTLPIASPTEIAAASSTQWFVTDDHGALLDGSSLPAAPRYFGRGGARSIAGGGDRVALATASGTIVCLNAETSALEGEIPFSSSKVQLSSDGTVLAAAADTEYGTDRTLKIVSLPSRTELRSLPYDARVYPVLADFSLSGSGAQLGQVLASYDGSTWTLAPQVSPVAGGVPSWTGPATTGLRDAYTALHHAPPVLLSPSGARVAASTGAAGSEATTNLYANGTLVTAVPGWGVGWVDEGRLLVSRYDPVAESTYLGAEIYDATGVRLAQLPLPQLQRIQSISASAVYSPDHNAIFSLETGEELWRGPPGSGPGAVAGGRVFYPFGPYLLSEPY